MLPSWLYWGAAMASVFVTMGCGIAAIVIPLAQAVGWLKSGAWTPVSIRPVISWTGFSASTDWVGLNKIVDWLLDLHPSFGLIVAAFLSAMFGGWAADQSGRAQDRREKKRKRLDA